MLAKRSVAEEGQVRNSCILSIRTCPHLFRVSRFAYISCLPLCSPCNVRCRARTRADYTTFFFFFFNKTCVGGPPVHLLKANDHVGSTKNTSLDERTVRCQSIPTRYSHGLFSDNHLIHGYYSNDGVPFPPSLSLKRVLCVPCPQTLTSTGLFQNRKCATFTYKLDNYR